MKTRKRKFWQPVVVQFMVLYLAMMVLATLLVANKFVDEFREELEQYAISVLSDASNQELDVRDGIWQGKDWNGEVRSDFYQELSNQRLWMIDNDFSSVSAAFYDENKNLLAQSRNEVRSKVRISTDTEEFQYVEKTFGLDDYLSAEELKELAAYKAENIQALVETNFTTPEPYEFYLRLSPDGQELWGIVIQELTWQETSWEEITEKEEPMYENPLTGNSFGTQTMAGEYDFVTGEYIGEKEFEVTDSRILWEWKNPAPGNGQGDEGRLIEVGEYDINLPYLLSYYYRTAGLYERWSRWNASSYLHDFPQQEEFVWEAGIAEPPFEEEASTFVIYRGRYRLKIGMANAPSAYAEIRMEARPWHAAMDYMKYIYLVALAFTLASMAKVIYAFRQTSKKQAALEETRRDFINAMAHELKTPLGVIRNFAENLMEHNMEEKRDYYLSQIIGQTEEMDGLVTEMIGLSKLESEKLELRKETVSFAKLIREQMERFSPMLREKNLQVRYEEKADFLVEGDREYLARAVWSLLSNAVDYNIPGGSILVRTEGERCIIENTGFPMGEEQLVHAFDLFYTEDQSRSGKDRHMGMGLFLAKKILELHGMGIALENTGDGVRAVISRR